MSNKVKLGIIGLGNMGTGHARNIVSGKVPNVELTAIADIDDSRLESGKGKPARRHVNLFRTEKVADGQRHL